MEPLHRRILELDFLPLSPAGTMFMLFEFFMTQTFVTYLYITVTENFLAIKCSREALSCKLVTAGREGQCMAMPCKSVTPDREEQ